MSAQPQGRGAISNVSPNHPAEMRQMPGTTCANKAGVVRRWASLCHKDIVDQEGDHDVSDHDDHDNYDNYDG